MAENGARQVDRHRGPRDVGEHADGPVRQKVHRRLVDGPAEARQGLLDPECDRCLVAVLDALHAVVHRSQHHEWVLLVGGQGRKHSRAVIDELTDRVRGADGLLALATGSYLGEGFDLPGLDTLVLAFPVSFKGRIIQYVGRLLRPDPAKTDIVVHDYHDPHVAVLVAMARKRLATYRQLGFVTPAHLPAAPPSRPDDAF